MSGMRRFFLDTHDPHLCYAQAIQFSDTSVAIKWLEGIDKGLITTYGSMKEAVFALNPRLKIRWYDPCCFACGATAELGIGWCDACGAHWDPAKPVYEKESR